MNKFRFLIALIILAFFVVSMPASAENEVLVYYWEPDGSISEQSIANAQTMRRVANAQGYVSLWLLLNYPFNIYKDEMTQEEIDAQDSEVASGFNEILTPLIRRGQVSHLPEGPFIRGPGIAVRATEEGLRRLLRDQRVLQITAAIG